MAEAIDICELNERIERQSASVTNLMTGMTKAQVRNICRIITYRLTGSDGHILLEGGSGLQRLGDQNACILIDAKYSRNPVYSGLAARRRYRYHDL